MVAPVLAARRSRAKPAGALAPVVVVHGGAGDVPRGKRAAHADGCRRAAEAGLAVLTRGGSAVEAAVRAAEVLEEDPRFNAGTGACLTEEGTLELDSARGEVGLARNTRTMSYAVARRGEPTRSGA